MPQPHATGVLYNVPQGVSTWHACPYPESFSAPAALADQSSDGNLTSSRMALRHHSAQVTHGCEGAARKLRYHNTSVRFRDWVSAE